MTTSKLGVFCDRLIEAGWLIVVIVTPLYFNSNTDRVMEADKLALVRTLATFMAVAWLIRWLDQRRGARAHESTIRSPWVWPTLSIVIVYLLTTMTAIFPYQSLVGAYFRPQGTYGTLAIIVVFIMILQGVRTRPQLDRLFVAIILTSLPIALYGSLQRLRLDPLMLIGDSSDRVSSTLGNPIFLGAYLIMVFYLTLGKLVNSLHTLRTAQSSSVRTAARLNVALYGLIALAQCIAILFTDSRGPWVGALVGLFVFVIVLALVLRARRLASGLLLTGLVAAVLLAVLNLPNTFLEPVRSAPIIGRLFHIFEGESGSGQVRTQLWQADARLLMENPTIQFPDGTPDPLHMIRPLIGYGPDSMSLVFTQLQMPEPAFSNEDHSHNETWDILLTTGLAGVLAYQLLFLSLFLYGFRRLGLLPTQRERNTLIGLWVGLGMLGVLVALGVGQPKYIGLGLPLGNVAGLLAYLGLRILRGQLPEQGTDESFAGRILLAAVMAGLLAHYVEAQFGLNLVTTQVMFWAIAGILGVLVGRRFDLTEPVPSTAPLRQTPGSRRPAWLGSATSYAFITAVILATLLFEFVVFDNDTRAPLSLLWRAITFDPVLGKTTCAVLALLLVTWAAAVLLSISEMAQSGEYAAPKSRQWLKMGGTVAALSMTLALVFGIGLCIQVGGLPYIPVPVMDAQQTVTLAEQMIGITNYYLYGVFLSVLLTAIALAFGTDHRLPAWSRRWEWVALVPVALATLIWVNTIDLNPIRADVYYKVGRVFEDKNEWDASILLFAHGIRLAPRVDAYSMALGRVLKYRANASKPEPASRFNDQTDLADVLALDEQQMAGLKRLDFLYAAQTMLLHAQDLNPLHLEHTFNLARFYVPELPIDSDAKTKLAEIASRYYAEAIRLSPGNVLLWNEWAGLDLDRQDLDAALAKLEESLRLDPKFNETYMALGNTYSAMKNLDQAATAYRQAIDLKPDAAEAYSKLAFVYYQQDLLPEAIASFHAYIALAPDAPNVWEAHKNLALIYKQTGDLTLAIGELKNAAGLTKGDTQTSLNNLIAQWQAP